MHIKIKTKLLENTDLSKKQKILSILDETEKNSVSLAFEIFKTIFPDKLSDFKFFLSINKLVKDQTRAFISEVEKKFSITQEEKKEFYSKKYLNLTPEKYDLLESMAENILKFYKGESKSPKIKDIEDKLYRFITHDSKFDNISKALKDTYLALPKEERSNFYQKYTVGEEYQKIFEELKQQAKSYGWQYDFARGWESFTIRSSAFTPDVVNTSNHHMKRYITFKKGSDLSKLDANLQKMKIFLANMKKKPFIGSISFKFNDEYSGFIEHTDNIVIHFRNKNDKKFIEEAIQETNFELAERSEINLGRTLYGADIKSSDSRDIADDLGSSFVRYKNGPQPPDKEDEETKKKREEVVANVVKFLSADKTSEEYKRGLNWIKNVISQHMKHRASWTNAI